MTGLDPAEMPNFIMYAPVILQVAEAWDTFFITSFPCPLNLCVLKLGSRLPITWTTIDIPLSHNMHQPTFPLGFFLWPHSDNEFYTRNIQGAKQLLLLLLCVYWPLYSAPSLVFLLFHTWFPLVLLDEFYLIPVICCTWIVLELQKPLPSIHCSNRFITSVLMCWGHYTPKSESLFFLYNSFGHLSSWLCSIPARCSHSILHSNVSVIASIFTKRPVGMREVCPSPCYLRLTL